MSIQRSAALVIVILVMAAGALLGTTTARAANVSPTDQPSCITAADASSSTATATHHASVVVTYSDRHAQSFCVEFTEDSISGLQLLQRTGLPLVTNGSGGLGSAVCSINGEGSNDPTNCFGSCGGGACAYWAYYSFVNGAWRFAQVGASQHTIHDGDIDGWAWGPGGVSSGAIPAQPGTICPPPATDTPTPAPTEAPAPTVTSAIPSATPEPATPIAASPTARPTSVRSPSPESTVQAPDSTATIGAPRTEAAPTTDGPEGNVTQPAIDASLPHVTPTPESAVRGIEVTPDSASPGPTNAISPTQNASASTTPPNGVVVIDATQGARNEARAATPETNSGAGRTPLIAFAIVVLALAGVAGGIVYRRRQVD